MIREIWRFEFRINFILGILAMEQKNKYRNVILKPLKI